MKSFFIDNLKKYGSVSDETAELLHPYIQHTYKKKGTLLLKQGHINDNLYIIEKGLIRFFYNNEDSEVTNWFCTENMVVFNSRCFFSSLPSNESLELLEDSSLYSVSSRDLNKLYKTNIELSNIGRKIAEEYCIESESRISILHTKTAGERYQTLVEQTPEILQRVSLGHIASYLGVTQETVSRIRKTINKQSFFDFCQNFPSSSILTLYL